jgi:hypothetical protein
MPAYSLWLKDILGDGRDLPPYARRNGYICRVSAAILKLEEL